MTEQEWKDVLASEGFSDIYIWHDDANVEYPDHLHEKITAHVILSGGMELNDHGHVKILKAGERFDIKAGTTHSAKIGPDGCRYVVGEK